MSSTSSNQFPRSKAGQLAEIIRDRITRGEWNEQLPSERSLAKEYIVSRSCLRTALDILNQEGILAPAEPSKPRRITATPSEKIQDQAFQKVIVLTPTPAHEASPTFLGQLAELRHLLNPANLSVEEIRCRAFLHPDNPENALKRVISKHPNSIWILHQSPESVQLWFQEHKVPSLIFGSAFPSVTIPSIDIDFQGAARHATGRLLARDHRRIAILIHRSSLAGDDLIVHGVREAIASHPGSCPEPLLLASDLNRDRLKVLLDKNFSKDEHPTALIIHNEHHLLTAFTHLLHNGFRFPEKLSLIAVVNDSAIERLCPLPDRYDVGDRLIKALTKAVLNIFNGESPKSKLILPTHLAGETVSKRRP